MDAAMPSRGEAGDCAAAYEQPQQMSASSHMLTVLWGTWEMWCDVSTGDANDGDDHRLKNNNYSADAARARSASTANNTTTSSLCEHVRQHGTTWLDRVRSIGLFDSAEGFWGMFQCTRLPSQLPAGTSYYLFRKHIAPMWEHEANRRGGKWLMTFTATESALAMAQRTATEPMSECVLGIDVAWQRLCLALIGELLPCSEEEVCGATVSRSRVRHGATGANASRARQAGRPHSDTESGGVVAEWKLCLWTRTADDAVTQMRVAHYLDGLLHSHAADGDDDGASNGSKSGACCTDVGCIGAVHSSGGPEQHTADVRASMPSAKNDADRPRMSYVVHRDVMLAKHKQEHSNARGSFAPRYVLH